MRRVAKDTDLVGSVVIKWLGLDCVVGLIAQVVFIVNSINRITQIKSKRDSHTYTDKDY